MFKDKNKPVVYILALEPSGDFIGSALMKSLRHKTNGMIRIVGVGGDLMKKSGLDSLFDPKDLSILGIIEVLPKLLIIFRRLFETIDDINNTSPDIFISIDSWGFTGFIHNYLRKKNKLIKRFRYVAPQVWAWRPGRAKKLSYLVDHLLTLFPFEPEIFRKYGLKSTFVGHPIIYSLNQEISLRDFRKTNLISSSDLVISILPGSRISEVNKLGPVLVQTIKKISKKFDNINVIIPTVNNLRKDISILFEGIDFPIFIITDYEQKISALKSSDIAIAASGSVSLELAMLNVPHIITYKVNPISAVLFKFLSLTKYVNIINYLYDKEIIPELLQSRCNQEDLYRASIDLLKNKDMQFKQTSVFRKLNEKLLDNNSNPSDIAATAILSENQIK